MAIDRVRELMSAEPIVGQRIASGSWYVATEGCKEFVVEGGSSAELLIYDVLSAEAGVVDITLEQGVALRVVHVVNNAGSKSKINLHLADNATCRMTEVILVSAEEELTVNLDAQGANFEHSGLFILTDEERGSVDVNVRHNAPDCTSHTSMRGVASGKARGSFKGLVYVAPDAQRTDSVQSSRNIVIGEAHIATEPQLEIYADDVKCSHGATVGQMDADAILYMRQRGLSLADAKRLQIEGFVSDVVLHSAIEGLVDALQEMLAEKFNNL